MDLIPSVETARMVTCVSWLLLHRTLLDNGFILRRRQFGTDCTAALVIGLTSTLWTAAAIKAAFDAPVPLGFGGLPSSPETERSGRIRNGLIVMSSTPILTQVLFSFWGISMLDVLIARKTQRSPHLWDGSKPHDPFHWSAGLPPALYWVLMAVLCITVTVPSLLSISYGLFPTAGILNIAGLGLFVLGGAPRNPYTRAHHRYTDDTLRIALPTSHHEGTMYLLPGPDTGIDAVWSPKLAAEHVEADAEIMTLFSHMRADRWAPSEPLERLRTTMARYQARARISVEHAERLAAWIYLDKAGDDTAAVGKPGGRPGFETERASLRRIECLRAPGVHLIGRDLIFALCHAEYLVFMAAGRLRPETAAKFGKLRLVRRSGAGPSPLGPEGGGAPVETVGYGRPGLEGYRAAVEHVYAMFALPVDREAVLFDDGAAAPPSFSFALPKAPASLEEYASELWDLAVRHSESTFSALYFFTTVWAMEVGNVHGFHLFPLRVRDRRGDVVTQLVVWRQAWWAACLSQLVAVSPVLFGLFVAGFVAVP